MVLMRRKGAIWLFSIYFLLTQSVFASLAFAQESGTSRIAGEDRYQTAAAISQKGWQTSDYAVLARGDDFADALCAGPLAQKYSGPILLTEPQSLNADTLAELQRLGVKHLFIAGGTGAIAQNVEDELKAGGIATLERIYGETRYDTSVKIAEKLGNPEKAVLVTGHDFPDALSISVVAAKLGLPILLTSKNDLPTGVSNYFRDHPTITQTYIVGGPGVISADLESEVPNPVRLAGHDRYATNIAVLDYFASSFDFKEIFVAIGGGSNGNEFADALTGAVLAAKSSSPLILTAQSLPQQTRDYLETKLSLSSNITALGGQAVVSPAVLAEIVACRDQAQFAQRFSTAGTYGPETGVETIDGNVTISAADVTLRNTIIEGDLLLAQSIGDGNVYLKDVTVKGKTLINGGGPNSIIMYNFNGVTVTVDVPEGSNVRLVAQGDTNIANVIMESNGQLEEAELTGLGFVDIVIPANAQVSLAGDFNEVEVQASGANVTVTNGTIRAMTISETASGAEIRLAKGTTVTTLNADTSATISGQGRISKANIDANNVIIDQTPGKTTVADGITAKVGGKTLKGTKTSSSGGGGSSSGGGNSTVSVTGITVNPTTMTLLVGGQTGTIAATVSPENATNKNVTWSSSNEVVATVANGTVTSVAEGTATITATTVDGTKTATCEVSVQTNTGDIGDLTFRVRTPDGPDIEGATITIEGKTYLTDENGNVFIKIKKGYYEFTVEKEGYEFHKSSVSVGVTTHLTVYFYPIASDMVINIAAITGITAPVEGGTPVTTITENDQYTGSVTWSPESELADGKFVAGKVYTACITLTAKAGYTLTGVAAGFFTVEGATATNPSDSGVVTVVFPATAIEPPSESGIVRKLPTLAYDEDNERYLLAYKREDARHTLAETGIYGRFVLPDGDFSGEEFVIAPSDTIGTFSPTAVSYDTIKKRFLVVWDDARDNTTDGQWNLYGQFVSSEGVPLGAVFPISSISDGKEQTYPGIAFDSTSGNFLIIYNHQVDGHDQQGDLHCRLLTADGKLGDDKLIAGGQWNQSGTSVDFNGTDFLVAYGDSSNDPNNYNKVKRIDSTGTPSPDAIIFTAAGDGVAIPQLVYNTQLGQFLAVWSTRYVGTSSTWMDDICGSIVQKEGSSANPFVIADKTKLKQFYPDVAAVGNKFAVVWMDAGDTSYDIRAAIVSADEAVSAPIVIANNVGDNASPIVCGGKDGALAAYEVQIGDDSNIKDIQVKAISFDSLTDILVESIIITGTGDATTIASNETLQMSAVIEPANATEQAVTWSVASGPGTINADGLLTATGVGVITVKATAQDGSGVEGTKEITVETDSPFFTFESATGTITKYDKAGGLDVVIPSMIDGVTVTSIGYRAFQAKGLTSVSIPNSVINIGDNAFADNFLSDVTIPNSVTSIGEFAFSANKLIGVTIPNSVTIISDYAFSFNKVLASVTMHDNVKTIGNGAFVGNQLTSVTIPDSVITIDKNAFSNNKLISIVIGNQVTSIGEYAFSENQLTTVTIPSSVETIGDGAFHGNTLTSITIGAGVAFSDILVLSVENGLNFRHAYDIGGAGRYIGTQEGTWAKES